jgi:hypothetical protein
MPTSDAVVTADHVLGQSDARKRARTLVQQFLRGEPDGPIAFDAALRGETA